MAIFSRNKASLDDGSVISTPKNSVGEVPNVREDRVARPAPAAPTVNTGGQGIVLDSSGNVIESDNPNVPVTKPTPASGANTTTGTEGFVAADGTVFKDKASYDAYVSYLNGTTQANADRMAAGQSAYDILYGEFAKYGLGSLVEPLKGMIQSGATGASLSLALQNTKAYQDRFSANQARIAKGLSALSPAEYVAMEDQYQNIMRNYGLPASYYAKDTTGKQAGFEQLLANDVSAAELADRVATAQDRVINANPEVMQQLKVYYPDITNGDIVAYALDPKNALNALKQKVTAAEIGGAAAAAGLSDTATAAEQLAKYGVTGAMAKQNYGTIAELAQRGSQLADIYNQQPYGQAQAEAEVFNLGGQTDATKRRKKLTELEKAAFSGSSGTSSDALSRDRALSSQTYRSPGAGAF